MTADLIIKRLTLVETAEDGSAVRLIVDDADDQSVGIVLTIENLTALIMTLPTAASNAIKRAHNDPNMRITYPLTDFQIEISPGNSRILTVGTPDGFSVSFSLTAELSEELGHAHLKGVGQRVKTH
jgi:hypothetical protein